MLADKVLCSIGYSCVCHFPHDPNSPSIVPQVKLIRQRQRRGRLKIDLPLDLKLHGDLCFTFNPCTRQHTVPISTTSPPPPVTNQFTCITRHLKSCQPTYSHSSSPNACRPCHQSQHREITSCQRSLLSQHNIKFTSR